MSICSCCAQTNDIWEDKAESLSKMADFYYTAKNYDRAIDYEGKALTIKDSIFGKESIQYASSSLNIAKYYYARGCNGTSQSSNDFSNAITYLTIAMNTIKGTLLRGFYEMNLPERYQIWQSINILFDSTFPSYVAKNQNDSTISDLYNSILFSKGITWKEGSSRTITWKDIQNKLQEGDIAIEFISPVTPESDNVIFYALTIKKEYKAPHMIKLFDIWQFQDSLLNCSSMEEKNLNVGKLIWQALSEDLVEIDNVYFSPTHILHNIPIEYLPKNNNEYYCDQFSFFRLSSTVELVKPRVKKQFKKAILYGGLEYGFFPGYNNIEDNNRSGFEPLYNTNTEISEIKDILEKGGIQCTSYTGVNGNEDSFKKLSEQEFEILHLATHGTWVKTDIPRNEANALSGSFLVLSEANKITDDSNNDGRITALEISTLGFNNIEMVVLSACESALGEYGFDDGLLGLQRGFKIAGAKTILMSLDKVDDEATRLLMVEFYRNLMNGKTKRQSLQEAQQHLRKVENGKYDAPKYWASFIMLDGIN